MDDAKEDSFIHEKNLPFLNPTFPRMDGVSIAGYAFYYFAFCSFLKKKKYQSFFSSSTSKKARKRSDSCSQGKVPDFSVSFMRSDSKYEFFMMEAKPPGPLINLV